MAWWMRINQILTPRRMGYAWIAGGALWLTWLLSVLLGKGNFDLANHVVGTDYLMFHASGATLLRGDSAKLYDFEYQIQLEQSIVGPELNDHYAFITPPFLGWLFVPFALLPYSWSFTAWCAVNLALLWLGLVLCEAARPFKTFAWSLTWFPVFAALSFGQNSLLSMALLGLVYALWRNERCLSAGISASLLLYKPQLILGVALLWLLNWKRDWRALAGLILGGTALAGLSFGLLPEASYAYLALARDFLPGLIYREQFPLWHLHALRGFWFLLLPGQITVTEVLSILFSLLGGFAFIRLYRSYRSTPALLFAGAVCLTIWVTPHAMIYDWAILLIPAVILWEHRPQNRPLLKALYAVIWVGTLLSGSLTYGQLKVLPIALQISVPILFIVLSNLYKVLTAIEEGDNQCHSFR